jgi:hypothetical protein
MEEMLRVSARFFLFTLSSSAFNSAFMLSKVEHFCSSISTLAWS